LKNTPPGLLALLLLILGAVLIGAAQDRPFVFQVGSELVVLDVIATDADGREVSDLTRDEVQIQEDGAPRTIQHLQLVSRALQLRDRGLPTAAAPAAVTPGAPVPDRVAGSLSVVIVLDLNSMPADAMPRVRAAVLDAAGTGASNGVSTMIVTIREQLEVVQTFTTDPELLRQAMERVGAAAATQTDMSALFERLDRICGIAGPNDVVNMGVAVGQDIVTEGNRRMLYTGHALTGLARSLDAVPGRKHIVLYSGGYTLNLVNRVIDTVTAVVSACNNSDVLRVRRSLGQQLGMLMPPDVTGSMRAIVDRATFSQASFYSVDPSGLTTTAVLPQQTGSTRGGRVPFPRLASMSEGPGHDYLTTLARDTGGRVFLNTNDLGSGLLQAQRDAQSYYLVGYEPRGAPKKSTFREVKISTTRRDVTLRYRRGYYAMSDRDRASADVDTAMQSPAAFRREGFAVSTATSNRVLQIEVRIPPHAIRIRPAGATERAAFSVHTELRPMNGRSRPKTLPGKDVVLDLSPDRMSTIRASDKVAVRLDSPASAPGSYLLTVVARDSGGWIAADTCAIVVGK
jgi:VWFA-related protein